MHHYVILCLFDITATGVLQYRSQEQNLYARNQHRNWQVIQQLISLRTQPMHLSHPVCQTVDVGFYNFGLEFTGQQRVWACSFGIEPEQLYLEKDNPVYWLESDFDCVPMITELLESVKFRIPCLQTFGEHQNICFYTEQQWQNRDFEFHFDNN